MQTFSPRCPPALRPYQYQLPRLLWMPCGHVVCGLVGGKRCPLCGAAHGGLIGTTSGWVELLVHAPGGVAPTWCLADHDVMMPEGVGERDVDGCEGVGSEGVGSEGGGSEGGGSEGVGSEGVGSEGVGSEGENDVPSPVAIATRCGCKGI